MTKTNKFNLKPLGNPIAKRRVDCMQAWIKEYEDGTLVLQSWNTDVVRRTPSGQYIRLWGGHSVHTSQQVKRAFDQSFRYLPFADGTYEDLKPEPARSGYTFDSYGYSVSNHIYRKNIKTRVKEFFNRFEGNKTINTLCNEYTTCLDKEIRQHFKKNKPMLELFRAMRVCLEKKDRQDEISMLCKLCNYDFQEVYDHIKHNYKLGELTVWN